MTTTTGDGDAGTGPGGGSGTGPGRLVQIWDIVADVIWSFRVTYVLLRQRWSR